MRTARRCWIQVLALSVALLPSGACAQDIATVAPTEVIPVDANSSSVIQPTNVSISEGSFRQKIVVGNGLPFDEKQVSLFQALYAGYTENFVPAEEIEFVNTVCTITNMGFIFPEITNETTRRHRFLRRERGLEEVLEPIEAMDIDYTMSFQSQHLNITHYEVMFQTWINLNLGKVAEGLRLLEFNVTSVEAASRLTRHQTEAPTIESTSTSPPTEQVNDTNRTAPPSTLAPTNSQPQNGLAIILSSLFIGACIIIAGLLVYWRKHRVGESKEFPRRSKKESSGKHTKRPTEEMSDEDIEMAQEAAPTEKDDDRKVRIKEPKPSSYKSSSKSSSSDEENPTRGEHYDDYFHHYYKRKNEKKERREKRKSMKEKENSSSSNARSTKRTPRDVSPPVAGESAEAIKARLKRLDELKDVMRPREYEERRSQILSALIQ